MTALKLDKFGGELPAWDSRLLPEGQASLALNTYLFSGALIGWRQPKLLHTLNNSAAKYAFRLPNKTTNNTAITALDSFWLEFEDADTMVVRSPVVDDTFQRYYWSSPSQRPTYNTYDRIVAGEHPWYLGVPASGCTPGVTVDGGGDTAQVGNVTVLPDAGGSDYRPGNTIFLTPIVPDGAMLVQSVTFMPASSDGALNFQAVIYSDLNGSPYELLGMGGDVTGVTSGVAATSAFLNGVSVISNVTYWIGIAIDAPVSVKVADTRVNNGSTISNTFSNGPPDFTSGVGGQPVWNMWADLLGSSVYTARAYVYTWVTAYGEEGPPSPPAIVNGWSNATWTVGSFQPEPENLGADYLDGDGITQQAVRNITHTRIYRSISNQTGIGTYFLVAEIPVAQASFEDAISDDVISFNSQLASLYWFEPPADLQGFKTFPNGIAVGWRENEIWFSEPYRPHAWPPTYVLTVEFPVVGIGVCGQSIVACTQGSPYLIAGVNPGSMALMKINLPEPCLHRGSIVSTDTTVLYVSQNGLIQISSSGAGQNVTEGWISRERWQSLTPQQHIRAIKHATSYFAFGTVAGDDVSVARRGYTIELSDQDQTSFTIWPQAGGHRLGFTQLSSPNGFATDNLLLDQWTGVGLIIQNGGVWYWDFTDQDPIIVPYVWRSKTYQQLSAKNFSAVKIWFEVPSTTPPQVERNTEDPQPTLGPQQYGILRVYADGQLYTTREIRKSGELLRIYSGIKVEAWQIEIEGRVRISNLQCATSAKELGLI
jgi:hypothetical protein